VFGALPVARLTLAGAPSRMWIFRRIVRCSGALTARTWTCSVPDFALEAVDTGVPRSKAEPFVQAAGGVAFGP
jgi:hypothetical protein